MIDQGFSPIKVNLIGNNLMDEGTEIVAESLMNDKVEDLNLSCNRITGKGVQALVQFLRTSTTLRQLCLFGNKISNAGAIAIADALKENTSLEVLSLGDNLIGDEGAVALANSIEAHPTLRLVDLSGNAIGDEGASALARACHSLDDLALSRNNVGDIGAIAFARALSGENYNLNHLRLADNDIGVIGARCLALALQRNVTSRTIDLRFSDKVVGQARKVFLETVKSNTTLSSIQLACSPNDTLQAEVDYLTSLNKSGRLIARTDEKMLPLVLELVSDRPSVVYGLLVEAPHLWT